VYNLAAMSVFYVGGGGYNLAANVGFSEGGQEVITHRDTCAMLRDECHGRSTTMRSRCAMTWHAMLRHVVHDGNRSMTMYLTLSPPSMLPRHVPALVQSCNEMQSARLYMSLPSGSFSSCFLQPAANEAIARYLEYFQHQRLPTKRLTSR
jgi:hypothetical protein